MFLRQEGHLSADDLFEHVRREAPASAARPSTAPCSGWSTPASRARSTSAKGARASRRRTAIRGTFISICTTCHRSSEFLSSDVEALMEEIAAARNFAPTQSVVQILGTCEECRTGTGDRRRLTARPPIGCSRATRCGWRSRPSAAASSSIRAPPRSPRIAAVARCSRSSPPRSASTSARSRSATRSSPRAIRSSNRVRPSSSSRAPPAACSPPAPKS